MPHTGVSSDSPGGHELTWPRPFHPTSPYSLGLMDSRGTVMLVKESSVGVGCGGGPGGSGGMVWRRLVAPGLGELQLLLLCRSRRVRRGAGCCFSLNGDSVLASDFLVALLGAVEGLGCSAVGLQVSSLGQPHLQ